MGEPENNWVERRAVREAALKAHTPEVWMALVAAAEAAVESFQRRYGNLRKLIAEFHTNGTQFEVAVSRFGHGQEDPEISTLQVTFYESKITAHSSDPPKDYVFVFDIDDSNKVGLRQGKTWFTPDEVSEALLKPLMFPEAPLPSNH